MTRRFTEQFEQLRAVGIEKGIKEDDSATLDDFALATMRKLAGLDTKVEMDGPYPLVVSGKLVEKNVKHTIANAY